MDEVFIVDHWYELEDGEEVIRTIGLYSSESKANEAVDRMKNLPGFRDSPDNFSVDKYTMGKDHWTGGFVSAGS